jgi:4-hydroxy-4-methyl-2-oxoglutarate aldolase
MKKTLTGRIAADRIRLMETPKPDPEVIAGFRALRDPVGVVADVMDELGISNGVVGTRVLAPTISGACIIGPALTLRNIPQRVDAHQGAQAKVNKMAEFEAHNLASPGDVLVIQGVANISNMGGISAQTGKRQGELGAIVWGGIRDIGHSRAIGYPIWASEFTTVTGKWRIETMEINAPVQIVDVRVEPGDVVIADDTSVCFVPRDRLREVLEGCQKKAKAEAIRCDAIDKGVPIHELIKSTYGEAQR